MLAIINLIKPLEFYADYRPHFTIYDPEFMNKNRKELPLVVGCANPIIFKDLTRKYRKNPAYMGAN